MRRLASEVLRDLQVRVARLERESAKVFTPDMLEREIDNAGRLSNVDPALAKYLVEHGDGSKDKIKVKKTKVSAGRLNPSQTTMVLGKSVGMALAMLNGNLDTDLGALISNDGQIMDGHHRWSAAIIAFGPRVNVGGYMADLEGRHLLKVLNIVSKGEFNVGGGKPGTGDITQYTPQAVENELRNLVLNGNEYNSADKIKGILEKEFGSVEEGIATMSNNVKGMSKKVPSWAPDRSEMPVIEPEQVPQAAKMLSDGEVEWNKPYPSEIRLARQRREQFRRHY